MIVEVFATREKNPDLVSSLIMKKIGAPYSHVGLLIDGVDVYHATGKGVNKTTIDAVSEHGNQVVKLIDVSDHIRVSSEYCRGWLDGSLGKEYSQSQLLGFVFSCARRFLKNQNEKMICSEYVAQALVSWEVLPPIEEIDFVDPHMLIGMVEKL